MAEEWRLLDSGEKDGCHNLAVDESIFFNAPSGSGLPVLRFYKWKDPVVSIGYFQKYAEINRQFPSSGIMRRITGGGSVFHGNEVPFSAVMQKDCFGKFKASEFYLFISEIIAESLGSIGIDARVCRSRGTNGPLCFNSPQEGDLEMGGSKVYGAAQRRSGNWLLHQASIKLSGVSGDHYRRLKNAISMGFSRYFRARFTESGLTAAEEGSTDILLIKYKSSDWNRKY